ncbi:MAG: 30S ribosomal protein S9 [Elusimicrobia bacterium RIFOXYA2_FULL_39_19]|nr:MAG: 30S ribosomal protein S9 [Elusimicrobia bacterium RIFOXYA2_FULL_39_19]
MSEETKIVQETKSSSGPVWTTGKRKTSIARVRMLPGSGKMLVNSLELDKYFKSLKPKSEVVKPIQFIGEASKFDYHINVRGGGSSGQSEAIKLAISRALCTIGETVKKKLRDNGFLTRDSRIVERKKPGQPKARKKFQWTKR